MVRKARPVDSFFNFFNPPVPPSDEAIEQGDIDDDELEELEERLEMDYQLGEDFKENVRLNNGPSSVHDSFFRLFPELWITLLAKLWNTI